MNLRMKRSSQLPRHQTSMSVQVGAPKQYTELALLSTSVAGNLVARSIWVGATFMASRKGLSGHSP